jgi:site-specific DNA-methyltransferase (adenine-specific)
MNKLQVPNVSVVAPQMLKKNSTIHSMYVVPVNYDEIRNNIQEFGLLTPLLVNFNYEIISGNLRHQIALDLGFEEVPVVFIDTPEELKAVLSVSTNQFRVKSMVEIASEIRFYDEYYSVGRGKRTDLRPQMKVVKDEKDTAYKSIGQYKINRIKSIEKKVIQLHGDNVEKLNKELSKVDKGEITLNQLDKKLDREVLKKCNEVVVPEKYDYITEKVKIFNSSCEDMYQLEDNSVQLIVSSPPYFQARVYKNGENELGREKTPEEFINNLVNLFDDAKRVLKDEGSLYVNINDTCRDGAYQAIPQRFVVEMLKSGSWILNDEIIWTKTNPKYSPGKRSVRSHEYIFHFVKSKNFYFDDSWLDGIDDKTNTFSYGTNNLFPKLISGMDFRDGVVRTNVATTQQLRKKCEEKGFFLNHTAVFPEVIPIIPILTTTRPGDTVLDLFNGTGTVAEVCIKLQRGFYGFEYNPEYVMASEVRLSDYELAVA